MPPTDIPTFTTTQLSLLSAELAAEVAESSLLATSASPAALQRAGFALTNLTPASQRTGPGGRTVVTLEPDSATAGAEARLPAHGIRVGDIVGVRELGSGAARRKDKSGEAATAAVGRRGVEGVVVRVGEGAVSIALEGEEGEVPGTGERVWIVKLANDITYKRMNQTMTRLQKMSDSDLTPFIRILFGQSTPSPISSTELSNMMIDWIDPTLNASQQDAIRFALASHELALIHGPPGTGKTHTLIELILQLLKQGKRLLVCGPSNISVDNIVERLAPHKVPIVRLGHPARLLPSVLSHSLDVLTQTSDAAAIVRDVRREMDDKQASLRKTRSGREKRAVYQDLKELRKEFREREKKCVENLVAGSKVVLATLHGAGGFHLKNAKFDAVIIDEASQALEAQCWVALVDAKKVILAGDHLQLPPTIKSLNSKAVKAGKSEKSTEKHSEKGMTLETTLFDRLLELHGHKVKRMLTTQYRMHEKVMAFPSVELYDGKLTAAESVRTRLLKDLPYEVEDTDDTREALVFWDTQGGDFPETTEDEGVGKKAGAGLSMGESKSNSGEASVAKLHVRNLINAGVMAEDIAVITPYNAQLALLSRMLREQYPGIEFGSVDGFQGREKEAVVVSLVRSGADVGFLAEKRRLNVSMTRPKRHLCAIGDSATLTNPFLKRWMAHLEEHGDLRYPTQDELDAGEE